jgi:hypothetical protein
MRGEDRGTGGGRRGPCRILQSTFCNGNSGRPRRGDTGTGSLIVEGTAPSGLRIRRAGEGCGGALGRRCGVGRDRSAVRPQVPAPLPALTGVSIAAFCILQSTFCIGHRGGEGGPGPDDRPALHPPGLVARPADFLRAAQQRDGHAISGQGDCDAHGHAQGDPEQAPGHVHRVPAPPLPPARPPPRLVQRLRPAAHAVAFPSPLLPRPSVPPPLTPAARKTRRRRRRPCPSRRA